MKLRFAAIRRAVNILKSSHGDGREGFAPYAADARKEFESALDGNMGIPRALAVSEKFALECADAGLSRQQAKSALALLAKFDSVLACLPL